MKVKYLLVASLLAGLAFTLSAQQSAAPQSNPTAPANAEVLKLLKAGMSESVVLNKIHATTEKFDTSSDALVALKQAGANDAELNAMLNQGVSSAAPAPAAAPSVPAASDPSPDEPMKFIQDQLSGMGSFEFEAYVHDTAGGLGSSSHIKSAARVTDVVADPAACHLSFRYSVEGVRKPYWISVSLSLRDIQKITVLPYGQWIHQNGLKGNHPNDLEAESTPPITVLAIDSANKAEAVVFFTDDGLAHRVANEIAHAVTLCGGGNKDPF